MTRGGANPGWPVKGLVSCRTAGVLTVDQCEQVAESLRRAQVASEQTGDAVRARVLAVAYRVCLACRQSRSEVEWHRRAYEEADQRGHQLRQQLYTILDLISGRETPATREVLSTFPTADRNQPERDTPESAKRPSLWQRIQRVLERKPSPRSPKRQPPAASAGILAAPPVGRGKPKEQASPSLVIYCLGPFRVYQNDKPITVWNSLKGQCILKYLVAHGGRPIAKDILMDLSWPDADPEAARRNLHQAIYSLRQTLRRGHPDFQHIQFENDCYLLNPEMDTWLDSEEFEKHVQAGRGLEAVGKLAEAMAEYGIAEGLYQGDFLEEDLYQDWSRVRREHIRAAYFDIAGRLSEYYAQQGEYTAATALCQKVLARDNCREEAHRRLMRCYLAQGQRHLAVRQYQACVQALKEELDLTPSEDTVALYRRITTA